MIDQTLRLQYHGLYLLYKLDTFNHTKATLSQMLCTLMHSLKYNS